MADQNDFTFELRQVEPGDNVAGLSLGDQAYVPLKIFFEKKAKIFHANDLAKTYIALKVSDDKPKIAAYITLVCGEISVDYDILEDAALDFNYAQYPALKIARLAVDKKFRNKGLGENLVSFALGIAKEISSSVGCRFVVVDSKQQSTSFYEKRGFSFIDTPENKSRKEPVMFIDLHKVKGESSNVVKSSD